jgi:hypothetical protein
MAVSLGTTGSAGRPAVWLSAGRPCRAVRQLCSGSLNFPTMLVAPTTWGAILASSCS